jgi:KaiC/GvpD/RAD55 family RecA-like ATPase/transcriptional regulator with XRE-family HTH domain
MQPGRFMRSELMTDVTQEGVPWATFVEALTHELHARQWSQKGLAAFLGRDASTVSLWLSGRQRPRAEDEPTMRKLAEFLRLDPADVRDLVTVHTAQGDAGHQAGTVRPVRRVSDLKRLLFEDLSHVAERMLLPNTDNWMNGVRERLREQGYDADAALLREVLGEWLQQHPLPPGETYTWDKDGAVLIRGTRQDPALTRLNTVIPPRRLLEGFRTQFHGDAWIRDAIRQLCARLNAAFTQTGTEELPAHAITAVMHEVLHTDYARAEDNIIQALLQGLLMLKLLGTADPGVLRRRWELSPEFVINRLFGLALDIPGLDFLLEGGLLPPSTTGLTLVIKGRAGTGKTMLALQLAASIAAQGHLAIYLSAEEPPNVLTEQLSYAGYGHHVHDATRKTLRRDGREFALITSNFLEPPDTMGLASEGLLLLVSIPNRRAFFHPKNRLLTNLEAVIRQQTRRPAYVCYVVDSMDAVLDHGGPGGRRLIEDIFNVAKLRQSIGVFISEEHHAADHPPSDRDDRSALRDYLADIVITVGYRQRKLAVTERILTIEKCRTQAHFRGAHLFSIQSGRGITVYPSIASLLSMWRKRRRIELSHQPESWKVDEDLNFDRVLRGDVVRGSSILVAGPPSTHKLLVALSFLASGLEAQTDTQMLLISLRDDEAAMLRIIHTYPQFHRLLARRGPSVALSPRVTIVHVPPGYYTAERFLHWMRQLLKDPQRTPAMVSRVVFSTVDQLRYSSPMCAEEPLLIAALTDLFKREHMTSLFLAAGGPHERETGVAEIFDTIIVTEHDPRAGPDQVLLTVSQSSPGHADRRPRRLERRSEHSSGRLVLIQP